MNTPWLSPPFSLILSQDEVHVWRVPLDPPDEEAARFASLLAPDEAARAARYRYAELRREYVVGRGALRALLGAYLGAAPRQVALDYEDRGRPVLAANFAGSGLRFNLSNARDLALIAITRGRGVGVDLESDRRRIVLRDVAARFFAPAECERLFALPEDTQRQAFFDCWTRKEAYLKARGTGLSRPLDRFEVAFAPGQPAALLKDETDPGAPDRWSLTALEGLPGYTAALAVEAREFRLACFEFLLNPEHR
ncbi:MAG TPA: 4'-phosphopantetheinyl transferase superfamily protein [Anaerolineaceae bacterium]